MFYTDNFNDLCLLLEMFMEHKYQCKISPENENFKIEILNTGDILLSPEIINNPKLKKLLVEELNLSDG